MEALESICACQFVFQEPAEEKKKKSSTSEEEKTRRSEERKKTGEKEARRRRRRKRRRRLKVREEKTNKETRLKKFHRLFLRSLEFLQKLLLLQDRQTDRLTVSSEIVSIRPPVCPSVCPGGCHRGVSPTSARPASPPAGTRSSDSPLPMRRRDRNQKRCRCWSWMCRAGPRVQDVRGAARRCGLQGSAAPHSDRR